MRVSTTWRGGARAGQKVGGRAVFPRIEAKDAIEKMRELEEQETRRQSALVGKEIPKEEPIGLTVTRRVASPQCAPQCRSDEPITIDDFVKVDLRVGLVKSAEPVKGADKLLHLNVDIGEAEAAHHRRGHREGLYSRSS